LGIFLGIGSLLVNVAFIRAMDDNVRQSMESIGGLRIVTINTKEATSLQEMRNFQRSPGLTRISADTLAKESPYIEAYLPLKELHWRRIQGGGNRSRAHIKAIGPQYMSVYNYKVRQGRAFTNEDHLKKQHVCIIGKRVAERLFEGADPIGKKVVFAHHPFTIVGIIHTETLFQQQSREVLFPYSVYAAKFESPYEKLDGVTFLLHNSDNALSAKQDLELRLLQMHRGAEDFEVVINQDKINDMKAASMGMKILLFCIAGISLLVGGISIMNIMFATIGDRIREIGVRKALGAHRIDILAQFLIEAIVLCFVGGIPGTLIGYAITLLPPDFFPFVPRLSPFDYIIAIGFTVLVGLLSGLAPSIKAAGMKPVEALQY